MHRQEKERRRQVKQSTGPRWKGEQEKQWAEEEIMDWEQR